MYFTSDFKSSPVSMLVFDKKSTFLKCAVLTGAFIHSLIILWPILASPFSGDDTFDSMVPMQLQSILLLSRHGQMAQP